MPLRSASFAFILVLVAGLALGFLAARSTVPDAPVPDSAAEHALKHLDPLYVCPMHPDVISDRPGDCPICGMALVKRDAQDGDHPGVVVSSALAQGLGLRLARVDRGAVRPEVQASGLVQRFTPARHEDYAARTAGKVVAVHVKPGDIVEDGRILMEIDVPGVQALWKEFSEAAERSDLAKATELRGRLLDRGVSGYQIADDRVTGDRAEIPARFTGTVKTVSVVAGTEVAAGAPLLSLDAPAHVEVELRSFSIAARRLKGGDRAWLSVPGSAMVPIAGYIEPRAVELAGDEMAGLFTVLRGHFDVMGDAIRIGDPVSVRIDGPGSGDESLRVPADAVIRDGRGARVIRRAPDGALAPVAVRTGVESAEWMEVVDGLSEGDEVVVSAQFLVDSEASLRAALRRMSAESAATPP